MRARRCAWLLAVAVSLAVWPGAGRQAAAQEKLTVGVSALAAGQGGLLMARDHGFFRAEGLDVEFVFFASGTEGAQALLAGQVPVNALGGAAVVAAALAGADLVLVASFVNTLDFSLVVAPGITTAAQLRGKVLGINRFGASGDLAARLAVAHLGLDPARDVTYLQLGGSGSARLAAVKAGSIQGTVLSAPGVPMARALGFVELVDLSRVGVRYPLEAIAVSRAFVRDRPETLRKLLRGVVQGNHAFKTRRDDALRTLRGYLRTEDAEVLARAYEFYARVMDAKPYVPLDGVQTVLDQLAIRDPRARAARPEDFLDMRFVRELDESGFIDRLYR